VHTDQNRGNGGQKQRSSSGLESELKHGSSAGRMRNTGSTKIPTLHIDIVQYQERIKEGVSHVPGYKLDQKETSGFGCFTFKEQETVSSLSNRTHGGKRMTMEGHLVAVTGFSTYLQQEKNNHPMEKPYSRSGSSRGQGHGSVARGKTCKEHEIKSGVDKGKFAKELKERRRHKGRVTKKSFTGSRRVGKNRHVVKGGRAKKVCGGGRNPHSARCCVEKPKQADNSHRGARTQKGRLILPERNVGRKGMVGSLTYSGGVSKNGRTVLGGR